VSAHRTTAAVFHMELVLENGWYGNQWMGDHMAPRADVVEDKDAYHFYIEMPGLTDGSIDVHVKDDRLMVASERKRPEWPQEMGFHIAERDYGTIRGAFTLPLNASRDGIRASYIDGILELILKKRAESKPTKVQVN
jgi:HSP20 family protein